MIKSLLRRMHRRIKNVPVLQRLDAVAVRLWFRLLKAAYRLILTAKLGALALRRRRRLTVLCRFGGLGDVICSFPAAREYIRRHPEREIVYVTLSPFRDLVKRSGLPLRSVGVGRHVLPPRWASALIGEFIALEYANEADDLHLPPLPLIDDFARTLGIGHLAERPTLTVDPQRVRKIREIYLRPGTQGLILLHTGPTWKVREWPLESWIGLVRSLKQQAGTEVLQIVAARNVTVKDAVCPVIPGVIPVPCADDVARLVETIAAVDLLIAVESGPVHVAQAVGTNCVALFGPTDPALRIWKEETVAAVYHRIDCSFCHHRHPRLHWQTGCPFGIACMQKIEVEEVFNQASSFLAPMPERIS